MVKRPSVKEATVEAELFARVTARGGICVKVGAVGRRGFFDRLVIMPGGRVIFAEIKKPRGGRVSVHQKWYHAIFKSLEVEVAIVKNSADIDALLKK